MLYWANKLSELNFGQLMELYSEGNLENAREFYPNLPENQQILAAEQSFHQYLRECFFRTAGAKYALWVVEDCYVSALRLEPYQDGLLLEALESHPQYRKQGYASSLIRAVLAALPGEKIYSHVGKRNTASLKTHEKCGFQRILEHAVYADGSVLTSAYTYCRT